MATSTNHNDLKIIRDIVSKYKNKFIPTESSQVSRKYLEEKNDSMRKIDSSSSKGKGAISKFEFDKDKFNLYSNNSFKINQENVSHQIVTNKEPDKTPIFSPVNKSRSELDASNHINISRSNLDSSLAQMEMINTVKKAMEMNANYMNAYKFNINVNNSIGKSSMLSSSNIIDNSFNNNTQEYLNNIKNSLVQTTTPVVKTEGSLHLGIVQQIEDKISFLKAKLKQRKLTRIDFEKFSKIRKEELLRILEFEGNDLTSLWNSFKEMRNMFMEIFKSWAAKISNDFDSAHKNILKLVSSKVAVKISKRENKKLMLDLLIEAQIIGSFGEYSFNLISLNRYQHSKDFYHNVYPFDMKKSGPLNFWVIREHTYFHEDKLQKAYVQPIVTFLEKDQIQLNVNIVSERGLIDPKSFKWLPFQKKLIPSEYESNAFREICEFDLSRKCEIEVFKNKWSDIDNLENGSTVIEKIKQVFQENFLTQRILFDDVGYLVFKILLIANKPGVVSNKEEIGIGLEVVEKDKPLKNEVKKNYLIYDHSNDLQIRVGDHLVFYYSVNKTNH